jgi:hypothetical protein
MGTNVENAKSDSAARLKSANRTTALVLASIAVVFFVGIIATKFMGGPVTGIGIVGSAVLLFLVVAIGRNLRK